ncbi:MAG: hypothetical protein IPL61_38745 [Myxococcales bacterium]|nr:hypothetical protein [Myxococcales bacterium]
MSDRNYKRSWKNLLINKQYQLSFTLIMVGLATLLMALLGWWVIRVASEATTVGKSGIRGRACPALPEPIAQAGRAAPTPAPVAAPTPAPVAAPTPAPVAAPTPAAPADLDAGLAAGPTDGAPTDPGAPVDPTGDDPGAHHRRVVIESSSMTMEAPPAGPPLAETYAQQVAAHHTCELEISAALASADRRFQMIVLVMVGSGLLLILGLAVMGIKMTHKVAGPLYKVTLYLAKMRDGRYDKVYDLRKGDQLVEFYEHFKHAHAGAVRLERDDVARIGAALDAATASGALTRSPEAAAAAVALREVLARKEQSLGG